MGLRDMAKKGLALFVEMDPDAGSVHRTSSGCCRTTVQLGGRCCWRSGVDGHAAFSVALAFGVVAAGAHLGVEADEALGGRGSR